MLDTNVIVSGFITTSGTPRLILDAALEGEFEVVTSRPLIEELREVLARPHVSSRLPRYPAEPGSAADDFERAAEVVEPTFALDVIHTDPSDNRVLEAAVEGEADYIVSGDRDLLSLGNCRGIPIVPPAYFLALLAEG